MRLIKEKIHFIFAALTAFNLFVWINFATPLSTSVRFFDIGQGDAILIQDGFSQTLIDGGPNARIVDRLGKSLPKFDRLIDLIVITHFDRDHYNGIFDVIKNYEVGAVAMHEPEVLKPEAGVLINLIKEKNIPIIRPSAGEELVTGTIRLKVLNPYLNGAAKGNDRSIVVKYCLEECVLLTGDVGQLGLRLMERNFAEELDSDILKVPHHGSKNNLTEKFLKLISPEIAVISVGKNRYGHPSPEVLNLLKPFEVLRTDQDGTLIFYPRENKIIKS